MPLKFNQWSIPDSGIEEIFEALKQYAKCVSMRKVMEKHDSSFSSLFHSTTKEDQSEFTEQVINEMVSFISDALKHAESILRNQEHDSEQRLKILKDVLIHEFTITMVFHEYSSLRYSEIMQANSLSVKPEFQEQYERLKGCGEYLVSWIFSQHELLGDVSFSQPMILLMSEN